MELDALGCVIIGKLIPAGHRAEALPAARDRADRAGAAPERRGDRPADETELAAELGLTGDGELEGFSFGNGDRDKAQFSELADIAPPRREDGADDS